MSFAILSGKDVKWRRWQRSLRSFMIFIAAFAVWILHLTLSLMALYSQEDPTAFYQDILRPGYLLCWGTATVLIFAGFGFAVHRRFSVASLGSALAAVGVILMQLPNVFTFLAFVGGG